MELGIKKLIFIVVVILLYSTSINAQSLGVGASVNHTSNGINLFYSDYLGKNDRWGYDAGIRVTINTYSLTKNKQNYIFYQTGYANKFCEFFGLNFRAYRKIIKYKNVRLDAQINLFTIYQSLLMKDNKYDYNTNTIISTEEIYWKPAISFESTIGLQLQYNILPKIIISAASGIGFVYFNYQYESGWNRTSNTAAYWFRNGLKPNKDRGDYEVAGLDGMPMMSIGLKYNLNR